MRKEEGSWFYPTVAGGLLISAIAITGFVLAILAYIQDSNNVHEVSVRTFTTNYTEGLESPFDLTSPSSNCNYVNYEHWVEMDCNFVFPSMNSTNNGTLVSFDFQLPIEADTTQEATGSSVIYPDGGIADGDVELMFLTGNCQIEDAYVASCQCSNTHGAYGAETFEGVDYIGTLSIRYKKD
jgi:hypothetical protein